MGERQGNPPHSHAGDVPNITVAGSWRVLRELSARSPAAPGRHPLAAKLSRRRPHAAKSSYRTSRTPADGPFFETKPPARRVPCAARGHPHDRRIGREPRGRARHAATRAFVWAVPPPPPPPPHRARGSDFSATCRAAASRSALLSSGARTQAGNRPALSGSTSSSSATAPPAGASAALGSRSSCWCSRSDPHCA